ncbi:hypothetical protein GW17_00060714 [Ensete ventricosum]|nr:hypothetical protein GW17_00060714 [Ensete ventricosum]
MATPCRGCRRQTRQQKQRQRRKQGRLGNGRGLRRKMRLAVGQRRKRKMVAMAAGKSRRRWPAMGAEEGGGGSNGRGSKVQDEALRGGNSGGRWGEAGEGAASMVEMAEAATEEKAAVASNAVRQWAVVVAVGVWPTGSGCGRGESRQGRVLRLEVAMVEEERKATTAMVERCRGLDDGRLGDGSGCVAATRAASGGCAWPRKDGDDRREEATGVSAFGVAAAAGEMGIC